MTTLRPIDDYFLKNKEPVRGCLNFLRGYILNLGPEVSESWRYGMPFYYYKDKMFCYLWTHKKLKLPYIGFVDGKLMEHPDLLLENRAKMKILLIDPFGDLPVETINSVFEMALGLRK